MLLGTVGLSGCSHNPLGLALLEAASAGKGLDALALNPSLRYLRVSTPKRTVLMVLGYTDVVAQGVVETWYSGEGEVIRLLNGRLLASAGLQTDWRRVTFSDVPSWADMQGKSGAEYLRVRDEMPDYRYGIRETLRLSPVPAPANSRLQSVSASTLSWYQEAVKGAPAGMPSARYGIDHRSPVPVVVYGEQCFRHDGCISWQTWPAVQ